MIVREGMLPLQSWAMDGENRRHVPVGLDDQHPPTPELRTNPQIECSLVRVMIHDLPVLHRDVLKLFTHVADTTVAHDSTVAEALSPRERDVLCLLADGLSNAQIAAQLYLSEGTVRNYVSGIFTKLGVTDRTQAAVIALRHGLVD